MLIDREAPLRFLRTGYEPADWVAVFLKTYRTGETAQRVVSVSEATSPRFQSWLRQRNVNSWNVYVSVNAVRPGRSRSRRAICGIRHVFLEEDMDGPGLLASLTGACGDSTPVPWRRFRNGWQENFAATRPRHRARRRPGFPVSRTTSARHPHRSRSNTCVRERCLEPTIFPGVDPQRRTVTEPRPSSVLMLPIVRLAPSVFCWPSSLPLQDSTATCAHFESAVGWFADSSFQITRRCPSCPSGTHGVSPLGPNGNC